MNEWHKVNYNIWKECKNINLSFVIPVILGTIITAGGVGLAGVSLWYDFGMGEGVILVLFGGAIGAIVGILILIIGFSQRGKNSSINYWNTIFKTNGEIIHLTNKKDEQEVTFHISNIVSIQKQTNKRTINALIYFDDDTKITLYELNQVKYDQIVKLKR